MSRSLLLCSSLLWFTISTVSLADEARPAPETPPASAAKPSQAEIATWIVELSAGNFDEREQATKQLAAAGDAAVPALAEAAQADSLEASRRALDILKGHFQGDDANLKAAAEKALKGIASADNEKAAQRAKQILEPDPEPQNEPQLRAIPFPAARIQIQIQDLGVRNRKVQTRIVDGVKTIEAVEDGRQVKIVEDPDQGITVEVIEKKDGKEATAKYAAKNVEELKKEHPEAHKLYEQYSQPQAQIQLNGIQIQNGLPQRLPIPARRNLRGRLQDVEQLRESIDKAAKQLDETTARLKKLIEAADDPAELRKAVDELQAARQQLADVEKRLQR